jgi:hypothetical protein
MARRWRHTWFSARIRFEMDALDRYLDEILEGLSASRDNAKSFAEGERHLFEDDESRAVFDDHYSDWWYELSEVFPRLFLDSFLITLMSFVEHELVSLCDRASVVYHNQISSFAARRAVLRSAVAFLRSAKVDVPDRQMFGVACCSIITSGISLSIAEDC